MDNSIPQGNLTETLGNKGAFGEVFLSTDPVTLQKVAIKRLCFEDLLFEHKSWLTVSKILKEIEIHSQFEDTEGVVKFHKSWIEGPNEKEIYDDKYVAKHTSSGPSTDPRRNYLYIQMELCLESLDSFLDKETQFQLLVSQKHISVLLTEMFTGLNAIHSKGIIHRDIHPGNIFVSQNVCLKIGDFGLSREHSGKDLSSKKGNDLYWSPEMAAGDRNYSFKSDSFSMGLVSILFLCEKLRASNIIRLELFNGLRSKTDGELTFQRIDRLISDTARVEWSVVYKMLKYSPEQRRDLYKSIKSLRDVYNIGNLIKRLKYGDSKIVPGFSAPEHHCFNLIRRSTEMDKIESLIQSSHIVRDSGNIPIICISGSPCTGKSTLAIEACKELSTKDIGIVWLDCEYNFIATFKEFCLHQDAVPKKLIFVFDNLDSKDEGSLKLLIDVLRNTEETESINPTCIIVTSQHVLSIDGNCHNLPLDYDWITSCLNQAQMISLPTFIENVLKDALKKDPAIQETVKTLEDVFYRLHSLMAKREKFIDILNVSLNLICLVGHLKCEDVKVQSFILFLSKMTSCSSGLCRKVITTFGEGLLRVHSPLVERGQEQTEYVSLVRLHSFAQAFILPHKMVQFVFKTQLGYSEPQDNFTTATYAKFLKAWNQCRLEGGDKLVDDIYTELFPQIADALILDCEYLEENFFQELLKIVKDFGSVESIETFYNRSKTRLGLSSSWHLELSDVLLKTKKYMDDINLCLEVRKEQHLEYCSRLERFHKVALTEGAKRFLDTLRQHPSPQEPQTVNEEYIDHAQSVIEDIKSYIANEPTWNCPNGLEEPDEIFDLLYLLSIVLYKITSANDELIIEACELFKRRSAQFTNYKTFVPEFIIENIRNGNREKLSNSDFILPTQMATGSGGWFSC